MYKILEILNRQHIAQIKDIAARADRTSSAPIPPAVDTRAKAPPPRVPGTIRGRPG